MSQVDIYHNPSCSKSRQTLDILRQQGIEANIIEYLKQPPSSDVLLSILQALGIEAHQLLRVKEAAYQQHGLTPNSTQAEIIAAMLASPKLIERPIVVKGDRARIGRPPETVLEIL